MKTIFEHLNEAVSKFNGTEIFPDWLTPKNFGSKIKSENDLKSRQLYLIKDSGDDAFHGDYEFVKKDSKNCIFKDVNPGGDTLEIAIDTFSEEEIYLQK